MSDDILSQAEIDALLNGGDEQKKHTPDREFEEYETPVLPSDFDVSEVKPYDPMRQRRVFRERLRALEIINERFARQFRMGLFNLLRRSPDITTGAINIHPYYEFARNMPVPTNLNLVHLKPLRGTSLFVFSPSLVYIAVDTLFGGDGRFPPRVDGREFTSTEQRIIQRILNLALESYREAWSAIYALDVEYVRSELQVKFTNITTSANDIVVNTPFTVEIGSLSGEFNICIPFTMIEPLRELLTNPPIENIQVDDDNWRHSLASELRHSSLELVVNFTQIESHISEVLALKKGDILPIEKPELIEANVEGVPVLNGHYGTINEQYALRVEKLISSAINALSEEQHNE